jgi:hypothetical protein
VDRVKAGNMTKWDEHELLMKKLPGEKLQILFLSSPPWGVLPNASHDVELSKPEIEVCWWRWM